MEIQDAKNIIKLQQWSEMIQARKNSGQTVEMWCKENKISKKTYYYRLKQLRLAALKETPTSAISPLAPAIASPVFAELALCATDNILAVPCAITVRMGAMTVDIQNGASQDMITWTLKVLREIC